MCKILCKKVFRYGASFFCIFLFMSSFVNASPKSEFYIQQALDRYYPLPQDARTLSLSGFGIDCEDNSCIYLNPAGLSFTKNLEIGLSAGGSEHVGEDILTDESIEQTEDQVYGTVSIPLGQIKENRPKYGTLALGYSRYKGETNDEISSTPDGHRRTIGYGYAPESNIALGYSLTFYDDQLRTNFSDLHSQARFLHLIGLQAKMENDIKLSAIFKLGAGNSDTEDFVRQPDGLSRVEQYTAELGATKQIGKLKILGGVSTSLFKSKGNLEDTSEGVVTGNDESGESYSVKVGTQYEASQNFFVRTGAAYEYTHYRFERTDLKELSGNLQGPRISTGAGYLFGPTLGTKDVRLDGGLTYSFAGEGAWRYLITLAIVL